MIRDGLMDSNTDDIHTKSADPNIDSLANTVHCNKITTSITEAEIDVEVRDEVGHSTKQGDGDGCVICLGDIITSSTRAVASPCLHACFDFSCLATWLEVQNTCPLCKQEIFHVKYDFEPNGTGFKKYIVPKQESNKNKASTNLQRRTPIHHNVRRRERSIYGLIRPNDAIMRRRFIYKHQLRSLHCGTNRLSRFSNFTPKMVRDEAELQSKAKAWIRRELDVFEWTKDNREWLLEYLLAVVKSMNLKAADGSAEKLVEEFIGKEFAGVFVHELHAYLRSPFTKVEDFDNWSQYEIPVQRYVDGKELPTQDCSPHRPLVVKEQPEDNGSSSRNVRPYRSSRNLNSRRWQPYCTD